MLAFLLPYLPRIVLAGLVMTTLAGLLGLAHHAVYQSGYDTAAAECEVRAAAEAVARKHQIDGLVELSNQATEASEHDHAKTLSELKRREAALRAAVAAAGGLRIPASVCPSNGLSTAAAGAGLDPGAAAATVALPRNLEENLFAAAIEADDVAETARACQAWVIGQGLAKKPQADEKRLTE